MLVNHRLAYALCNQGQFPQLFGSTNDWMDMRWSQIDHHYLHGTTVAVGSHQDEALVTDMNGQQTQWYDAGITNQRYAVIGVFPNPNAFPGEFTVPSYFHCRYGSASLDYQQSFQNVAIYQHTSASLNLFTGQDKWGMSGISQSDGFFFVAQHISLDTKGIVTVKLSLFKAARADQNNSVVFDVFIQQTWDITVDQSINPCVACSPFTHDLIFEYLVLGDEETMSGTGSRPIVVYLQSKSATTNQDYQRALVHFLTPFKFHTDDNYQQQMMNIQGQTRVQKFFDGHLYILGGTERAGSTDYSTLLFEIRMHDDNTRTVRRQYEFKQDRSFIAYAQNMGFIQVLNKIEGEDTYDKEIYFAVVPGFIDQIEENYEKWTITVFPIQQYAQDNKDYWRRWKTDQVKIDQELHSMHCIVAEAKCHFAISSTTDKQLDHYIWQFPVLRLVEDYSERDEIFTKHRYLSIGTALDFQVTDAIFATHQAAEYQPFIYAITAKDFVWDDTSGTSRLSTHYIAAAYISIIGQQNCDDSDQIFQWSDEEESSDSLQAQWVHDADKLYNHDSNSDSDPASTFSVFTGDQKINQSVYTFTSNLADTPWFKCSTEAWIFDCFESEQCSSASDRLTVQAPVPDRVTTPDLETEGSTIIMPPIVWLNNDYFRGTECIYTAGFYRQAVMWTDTESLITPSVGLVSLLDLDINQVCQKGFYKKICELATYAQNSLTADFTGDPMTITIPQHKSSNILVGETVQYYIYYAAKYTSISAKPIFIEFQCFGGDAGGDCSDKGCEFNDGCEEENDDTTEENQVVITEETFPQPRRSYTHQCGSSETITIWTTEQQVYFRWQNDQSDIDCNDGACSVSAVREEVEMSNSTSITFGLRFDCQSETFDGIYKEDLAYQITELPETFTDSEGQQLVWKETQIDVTEILSIQATLEINESAQFDGANIQYFTDLILNREQTKQAQDIEIQLNQAMIYLSDQKEQDFVLETAPEESNEQDQSAASDITFISGSDDTTKVDENSGSEESTIDKQVEEISSLDELFSSKEFKVIEPSKDEDVKPLEEDSNQQEVAVASNTTVCTSEFGCDKFGNVKTSKGFTDESGKWVDLTNFQPSPEVLTVVEEAITLTADQSRAGEQVAQAQSEFYDEQEAKKLSEFSIQGWLEERGIAADDLRDTQNKREELKTLEQIYSIPLQDSVSQDGKVRLKFSSKITQPEYSTLQDRFIFIYSKRGRERRSLQESTQTQSSIMMNSSSNETQQVDELDKIKSLLKLSESIQTQLIPGTADNLSFKTYNWTLLQLDQYSLEIEFQFENPIYISAGDFEDKIKVSFFNTPLFLVPEDSSKNAIPNGWELNIMLPPQSEKVVRNIVKSAPETAKTGILTIIAANSWLSFIFGVSMQPLFDMVNSLQITALLPLTQLTIPSNVMELFDILITIVAFDFFPLYDPGFTETEPYSEKFAMFGFDTINYVQDLGTFLNALIAFLLIQSFITVIIFELTKDYLHFVRHQPFYNRANHIFKENHWIRKNLFPVPAVQAWIVFFFEAYIELLISIKIGFEMWKIEKFWNYWDKFAVVAHIIGIISTTAFTIFVIWFVVIKVKPLTIKHVMDKKLRFQYEIEETQREFKEKQQRNIARSKTMNRTTKNNLFASMLSNYSEKEMMTHKRAKKVLRNFNEDDYKIYEPMLEDLRREDQFSIYYNLIFLGRRVVFVFAIFFLDEKSEKVWQALLFCYSSLFVLVFNAGVNPFDSKYRNRIEQFNEVNVLIVGYFALQLLYSSWSPVMMNQVGLSILITILGGIASNLIVILWSLLKEIKNRILKHRKRIQLRKMKAKVPSQIATEVEQEHKQEQNDQESSIEIQNFETPFESDSESTKNKSNRKKVEKAKTVEDFIQTPLKYNIIDIENAVKYENIQEIDIKQISCEERKSQNESQTTRNLLILEPVSEDVEQESNQSEVNIMEDNETTRTKMMSINAVFGNFEADVEQDETHSEEESKLDADLESKLSSTNKGMLRIGKGKYIMRKPLVNKKQTIEPTYKGQLSAKMQIVQRIYQSK